MYMYSYYLVVVCCVCFVPYSIDSFQPFFIKTTIPSKKISFLSFQYSNKPEIEPPSINPQKIQGLVSLIRPHNIPPTLLLHFFGGWLLYPSILSTDMLSSPYSDFPISSLITVLVLSMSMVVNDIYDIELDTCNNPDRPLTAGQVSKTEAIYLAIGLIGITEFLNIFLLSPSLQWIPHVALLQSLFYTPVLKKIIFLKNMSCASLVSFTVFFSALSVHSPFDQNSHFPLLQIFGGLLFGGSLYNEILLDISDYEGDKQHSISTIPVVFGKETAWNLVSLLLSANILYYSVELQNIYHGYIGTVPLIIYFPFLVNFWKIKKENYSTKMIRVAVKETTYLLFANMVAIGILAKYF